MLATGIAQSGIQAGLARFDASAARTASLSSADASVDPADEAVEQMGAKQDVTANIAVLRTAWDMESTFEKFA